MELHWTWGGPVAPPNPQAPSLIVLDKHTGRLVAQDDEQIGTRLLHGQFSSPSLARVGEKTLVLYAGGDAVLYAFEPLTDDPRQARQAEEGLVLRLRAAGVLGERRQQAKPIEYRAGNWHSPFAVGKYGNKADRADFVGASEVIATPVFHQGRVYVAIGRDPAHGRGRGALHCIDPAKTGDITKTGKVWTYQGIQRSISTASVADGLVYVADVAGWLHCLDADTGRCYWTHDTESYQFNGAIWGSTLVADGKVYLVTRKSLYVFAAGKQKQVLATVRLGGECSPIAANGVLYVVLRGTLYALHSPDRSQPAKSPDQGSGKQAAGAPGAGRLESPEKRPAAGTNGPDGAGRAAMASRPKCLADCRPRSCSGPAPWPASAMPRSRSAADTSWRPTTTGAGTIGDVSTPPTGLRVWTYEYPNAEKMEFGAAPRGPADPWRQGLLPERLGRVVLPGVGHRKTGLEEAPGPRVPAEDADVGLLLLAAGGQRQSDRQSRRHGRPGGGPGPANRQRGLDRQRRGRQLRLLSPGHVRRCRAADRVRPENGRRLGRQDRPSVSGHSTWTPPMATSSLRRWLSAGSCC